LIKEIKSVKSSKLRLGFYYLGCVLSLGILYLLCRWMVGLWIFMRTTYTAPAQALYFIIIGMGNTLSLGSDRSETIVKKSSMVIDGEMRTVFEFRLYRYYYDDANSMFVPIETDFVRLKNSEVIEKHRLGITDEDHLLSITGKFGKNNTQIPDKGILKTLLDEVLSPFYIFQVSRFNS
jgi:cation-transporting ATPase 13A3/4/5